MNDPRLSGASRNPVTDHLDLWTSALLVKSTAGRGSNGRLEAYGIKKLRELILDLAVRGKLVTQDIYDEPARVILDKLTKKREKLIEAKKIRQAKLARDSDLPAVDILLPRGWALVQLSDLLLNPSDDIVDGPFGSRLQATEYVNEGVPIIRIQNIDRNFFKKDGLQYVTEKKAAELRRHSFSAGDVVLNKLGDPAGKACLVPSSLPSGIVVADIVRIALDGNLHNKQYLVNCINSPFVANQFSRLAKGVTRQRVNLSQVRALSIPIPPLREQHRIVAKVDELMTLCDQLEQQQGRGIEAHQTLVETLLGTLTNVESAQEFAAAWNRIAEHFDTLFTTEHSIDQLKQTILQLAVMGKLVSQDENDEPASKLLKQIAAEKSRMVKEGIIKKQKPLPEVGEDEKPFEIPVGWAWARWDEFTEWMTYGFTRPMPHVEAGPIILTAKNVQYGFIDAKEVDFTTEEAYAELNPKDKPQAGDILITKDGSIGRAAVVDLDKEFCINQSVAVLWMRSCPFDRKFLVNAIHSEYLQNLIWRAAAGAAIKHISITKFVQFPIAIPPLNEQRRIVAKVDELMALCDALKARLAEAQITQIRLADAIVERAVAAPEAIVA